MNHIVHLHAGHVHWLPDVNIEVGHRRYDKLQRVAELLAPHLRSPRGVFAPLQLARVHQRDALAERTLEALVRAAAPAAR